MAISLPVPAGKPFPPFPVLSTRQESFCRQFVATGNAAEAARRAGYARTLGAPDRPCPDGAAPYRRAGARDPAAVARDGAAGDRHPARPAGAGLGGCGGKGLALHDAPGDPIAGRPLRPVPARPASPGRPVAVAGRGRVRRAGTRPSRRWTTRISPGPPDPARSPRRGTAGSGAGAERKRRPRTGRRTGGPRTSPRTSPRKIAPDIAPDDPAVYDDPPEAHYDAAPLSVPRTGPDLQQGDDDAIDAERERLDVRAALRPRPDRSLDGEDMALRVEDEARRAALRPGIDTWEMAPAQSGGAAAQ